MCKDIKFIKIDNPRFVPAARVGLTFNTCIIKGTLRTPNATPIIPPITPIMNPVVTSLDILKKDN